LEVRVYTEGRQCGRAEYELGPEKCPAEPAVVVLELPGAERQKRDPAPIFDDDDLLPRQLLERLYARAFVIFTPLFFGGFLPGIRDRCLLGGLQLQVQSFAHAQETLHDARWKYEAVGGAHLWIRADGVAERHVGELGLAESDETGGVINAGRFDDVVAFQRATALRVE
jgi:hypothetical protein